jgi:integrase
VSIYRNSDYQIVKKDNDLGLTLYRRKQSPKIYYYFTFGKKSFRGSTKSSDESESFKYSVKKYNEIVENKGTRGTITLNSCVKKFLEYKKSRVSPRTYSDYKDHSKYLLERFDKKEVNSFTKSDYNEYVEWRQNYYHTHKKKQIQSYIIQGKKVQGKTYENVGNVVINREMRLLVSILRFSQEELGLLKDVKIPSWKMLPENRREEILTKDEYLKLKEYFIIRNPYYWDVISFVQNTGLRYPSEVNRLTWKDVNFKKKYITITDRKGKSRSGQKSVVPIVGRSREILEKLRKRDNISTGLDDFIFVNDENKQVKYIHKSFKKGLKECGIDKKLSMYSLRHLYTTRILSTRPDIPIKILSEVLGHVDTKMIDKYYGHLRPTDLVKFYEKSEEKKQEILKERQTQSN